MFLTWVQAGTRQLPVRVDPPIGAPLGALVIVPSVGREYVVGFRTARALAIRAAERGLCAFSLDLTGNGDAPGLEGGMGDLPRLWVSDIEAVVDFVESAGFELIHSVGIRLGGTLLSEVRTTSGSRIAWEPINGKSFLRFHSRVRQLSIPTPVLKDCVELAGFTLDQIQAQSIADFSFPLDGAQGLRILREKEPRHAQFLGEASPHQTLILDQSIRHLLDDLELRPQPGAKVPAQRHRVEVKGQNGNSYTETHCLVGPDLLPGILTEPKRGEVRASVVFSAVGSELKAGPGGLWASISRNLAGRGIAALRIDRRQLGELVDVSRPGEPRPYSDESVDDVGRGAEFLAARFGRPVAAVGSCSGAWSSLRAAATYPIDRCVAINLLAWNADPGVFTEEFYQQALAYETEFASSDQEFEDGQKSGALRAARRGQLVVKHWVSCRLPLLRRVLRKDELGGSISEMLGPVPKTCSVDLVMGQWEYSRARRLGFDDVAWGKGVFSNIDLRVLSGLDHSLFSESAKRVMSEHLIADLERFAARDEFV